MTTSNALSAVSHPQRRLVLQQLRDGDRYTADELARLITTEQRSRHRLSRREVHIQLVHNHLPRLADHEIIEYDRETKVVTHGEQFAEVRSILDEIATQTCLDGPSISTNTST